jgi:site-specific recombinase XerD
MFEKLFKYPRVYARHRDGPLSDARESYLSHRANDGTAPNTLLRVARELLVIATEINLVVGKEIGIEEIEAAAQCWARRQQRSHRAHTQRWSHELFVQTARDWLRFLGCLREPAEIAVRFSNLISDFATCMRQERGLSSATIHNRCWHAEQFLSWYDQQQSRPFSEVSSTDVDGFLALKGTTCWTRVSVGTCAKALRAFFLHAEAHGWCSHAISAGIESPRIFDQEGLPAGPGWNDVQRLIASTNTDTPHDIRDRGILMLFAIYGLRRAEVSRLRLEDFDWEREIIRVPRPKQRRTQDYPLTHAVGEAIIRYLKEVRPRCAHREVFLRLIAPIKPISPSGLYNLTRKRISQLGIVARHGGPHSLRHACAARLVSEGLSLKEIGDHLGHRSINSTRTYAKVDMAGLREVASFDLGGLL